MVNPHKKKIYKSGIILGYKRSLRNQNMDKVRIRISEANDINSQKKLIGAKVFYMMSTGLKKRPKTVWGKIISTHGKGGVFLAKFKKQISPTKITTKIYIVPTGIHFG